MAIAFHILTLFPEMFGSVLQTGLLNHALTEGKLTVHLHDLGPYSPAGRRMIDDQPFGGGDGMVMAPEPLARAIEAVKGQISTEKPLPLVYFTPQGRPLTPDRLKQFSQEGAILLCGRYSGIDERIRELFVDEEVSIGDYVLMGGELPAMVVLEASARFIPGVLGNETSAEIDSFSGELEGLLEGPIYTRPREFRGLKVPEVLLNGNHKDIEAWRRQQALARTQKRRPDLLKKP